MIGPAGMHVTRVDENATGNSVCPPIAAAIVKAMFGVDDEAARPLAEAA